MQSTTCRTFCSYRNVTIEAECPSPEHRSRSIPLAWAVAPNSHPPFRKPSARLSRTASPSFAACRSAGIAEKTAYEWIKRGDDCHSSRPRSNQFAEFAAAIGQSQALRESVLRKEIDSVAIGGQVTMKRTKEVRKRDGAVITTEVTRFSTPNWRAAAWLITNDGGSLHRERQPVFDRVPGCATPQFIVTVKD